MKRIVLALVAATMLAAPAAQAQSRNAPPPPGHPPAHHAHSKRPPAPPAAHRPPPPPHAAKPGRPPAPKHVSRWHRGDRLPPWQKRELVRDYHRYGLHKPPHGQHWVRVGNEYLLVGITTGIIAGLLAAH